MKKLIFMLVIGLNLHAALAAIPAVNQYKIEKQPVAEEPKPQQYSISEHDQDKVVDPNFPSYTQLNTTTPDNLYVIPPYMDAKYLPNIGKWMIAIETGQKETIYVPAHWLDELSAEGQYIVEPINYIFVVYNNNKNAAVKTLTNALVDAGFITKWSGPEYHTDNYHAYIGGKRFSQLKRNDSVFLTFSDNSWLHENDHFRVMGPYAMIINNKQAFLFISSVSEETAWDQKLYAGHYYVSFSHARDNLAAALIKYGYSTYYVLSSNILNTSKESTEDHDGKLFVTVFE